MQYILRRNLFCRQKIFYTTPFAASTNADVDHLVIFGTLFWRGHVRATLRLSKDGNSFKGWVCSNFKCFMTCLIYIL